MTFLLERAGVDTGQWRTLVRTFLKIDFAALRGAYGKAAARGMAFGLLLTAIVYGLSGLLPALVIARGPDVLLGATLMTTIVGFMVMSTLLAGEGVSIVSPDDHMVLGFRPVTSRTYFAARLTTLFVRTVVISALAGYAPVAAFLFRDGLRPGQAVAAALAILGTSSALTLALVSMYGWLLRKAGPARVMRVMSYAQLGAQTLTWGGFIFATRGLGALGQTTLSGTVWMFVYPPAWFASYIALARGEIAIATVVPAALSLLLLAALAWSLGGKLSLEYGERLSQLATTAAPQSRTPSSSRWLGLLANETRAVAILVRSQFRNDLKFRLGLLAMIPVSLIYLFIGAQSGPTDPFLQIGRGEHQNTGLIQLALFFLPMTLRRSLVTSESFRASWIFHASPADRARLVLAARDVITIFFLLPYLLLLGSAFAYFYGNVLHAAVHAFFLGCLSYLVLELTVLLNPQLPLSLPTSRDTNAGFNFGLMMLVSIFGYAVYFLTVIFIYPSPLRIAIALVCLLTVAFVLDRWTRARVRSRLALVPVDGV